MIIMIIIMRRVPEDCTDPALQLYLSCVTHNPEDRPTSLQLVEALRSIQPDEFKNPEEIL
jgi:hypothetical protein